MIVFTQEQSLQKELLVAGQDKDSHLHEMLSMQRKVQELDDLLKSTERSLNNVRDTTVWREWREKKSDPLKDTICYISILSNDYPDMLQNSREPIWLNTTMQSWVGKIGRDDASCSVEVLCAGKFEIQ